VPQRCVRTDRRRALVAIGALACAPVGRAQSFPSKPIKVLIGVPAGGTQDVLTRAIADSVRASLGPLIIDNRSGAAGRLAADAVKAAEPDGHTLLLGTAG
jgi:tripartite-type tricarboxylate transporter receptor subunit TctC